jgi:hypothetical protein
MLLEMRLGTVVKATKWHKPFTDYSYDLLLLALCLLLGPGAGRLSRLTSSLGGTRP